MTAESEPPPSDAPGKIDVDVSCDVEDDDDPADDSKEAGVEAEPPTAEAEREEEGEEKDGATHLLEAIGPAYARRTQFWKAILWSSIPQGIIMGLVALAFFNLYVAISKATWLTDDYHHALQTGPENSFWEDKTAGGGEGEVGEDDAGVASDEQHGDEQGDPLRPLRLGEGPWWYVALLAGGGFAVGLLKVVWSRALPRHRFPRKVPGFLVEVRELRAHDVWLPIPILLCSGLSLGFGASVGPEAALGAAGTTLGSLVFGRRWKVGPVQANREGDNGNDDNNGNDEADDDVNDDRSDSYLSKWLPDFSNERELCALDGMSAAFGALFPAQYLSGLMIHELGSGVWTEGDNGKAWTRHFMETVVRTGVASTVGYLFFTGLEDRTLLEEIPLPFALYSLLPEIRAIDMFYALVLGILSGILGLVGFVLLAVFGVMGSKMHDLFDAIGGRLGLSKDVLGMILTPTLGGAILGLICKAVPLVIGDGADQLGPLINLSEDLGVGTIVAAGLCKLVAVALSTGFGFIGGPIFPLIFAGTCLGVVSHLVVPDVPAVIAISSCMVAVPCAFIPALFSMATLASVVLVLGGAATSPVFFACLMSYGTVCGTGIIQDLLRGSKQKPGDEEMDPDEKAASRIASDAKSEEHHPLP
mmetsp:Transcript_15516/g.33527  ORF Transcript_15516/g.33527 Transcript_15516/m.33527 type:complete len:644 (+) Transcript_15516:142-2073(+)